MGPKLHWKIDSKRVKIYSVGTGGVLLGLVWYYGHVFWCLECNAVEPAWAVANSQPASDKKEQFGKICVLQIHSREGSTSTECSRALSIEVFAVKPVMPNSSPIRGFPILVDLIQHVIGWGQALYHEDNVISQDVSSRHMRVWLVAWHDGRTLVFDRRTSPVLRSTCSWWVTTYVGKPSAIGQPTRPTQPFIFSG